MRLSMFHVTVDPFEVVVASDDGGRVQVLPPGRHRRDRRSSYVPVSTARRVIQLAPQEIPTADGAQVKATAVAEVTVVDPVLALSFDQPEQVIYLAVQLAMRDAFADLEVAEVAKAARNDPALTQRVLDAAVAAGARVGYEVASVAVKDVLIPAELRAATMALLTAKAQGQAQLEAARAETAALRTLANGAKILEDHPALAKLRMVQAIPMGSSLSLRVDDGAD